MVYTLLPTAKAMVLVYMLIVELKQNRQTWGADLQRSTGHICHMIMMMIIIIIIGQSPITG